MQAGPMIYVQVTRNSKSERNMSGGPTLWNITALVFLAHPKFRPPLKNSCDAGDRLVL